MLAHDYTPAKDNEDVRNLINAAVASMNSTAGYNRGSCPQFNCKDEAALTNALTDTKDMLELLEPALHAAFVDYSAKIQEIEKEDREKEARNEILAD